MNEVKHFVGIADLVVVPRDNLYESIGEVNTCVGIEDRGQRATAVRGKRRGRVLLFLIYANILFD